MDIGHRLSRQRRHLPTNVTTLQHQGSSTAPNTSKEQQQQQQQQHDGATSSDDMDDDKQYHSQQRGRGRKLLAKKRMQQNFGNLVTLSKKRTMTNDSAWKSVQWRTWFWRFCIVWLAFLTLRVVTSIWQGDTTRLGLNQYLSRIPSIWWW